LPPGLIVSYLVESLKTKENRDLLKALTDKTTDKVTLDYKKQYSVQDYITTLPDIIEPVQ